MIALNSELLITESVTINGATAVNLSVDGGYGGRVFNLSAPATIISLTVMRGIASGGKGGGINSTDALTLTSVAVISSLAEYQGGGVYAGGALVLKGGLVRNNSADAGGGLYANSTLALTGNRLSATRRTMWVGRMRKARSWLPMPCSRAIIV